MRPLRVLQVIPSLALADGGPTRALLEIEHGLAAAGIEVTTVTTAAAGDQEPPAEDPRVRRVRLRRWLTPYKVAPGLVRALPELLARHDVVHAHALFSFAPNLAALAARRRGVPYILRPLGTLAPYGLGRRRPWLKRLSLARIEGPLLRDAAAVHFTSAAERDETERLGIPMRGVVIPPGLRPPGDAVPAPLDHPVLAGRTVVLFLSRLAPKKNLESLIDAAAGSAAFRAGGALAVAGDGPPAYVAALKARAERAGLAGRVAWLGHVDGPRKAALMAGADLFALPSLSENFGFAVVEALAAGLPCLLTPGIAVAGEVARDGAGLVVAPDAGSLRAALDGLLAAPERRRAMAGRARAAARRYDAAAMTHRLVALYEAAAATRRDGPRAGDR